MCLVQGLLRSAWFAPCAWYPLLVAGRVVFFALCPVIGARSSAARVAYPRCFVSGSSCLALGKLFLVPCAWCLVFGGPGCICPVRDARCRVPARPPLRPFIHLSARLSVRASNRPSARASAHVPLRAPDRPYIPPSARPLFHAAARLSARPLVQQCTRPPVRSKCPSTRASGCPSVRPHVRSYTTLRR